MWLAEVKAKAKRKNQMLFVNDLFCVIIGQKDGDSHESV
jgi:hypothetical protein